MLRSVGGSILYETIEQIVIGTTPTPVKLVAIDAGTAGNQEEGDTLAFVNALEGIDAVVTVVEMFGGSNAETDDELRERILQRIRNPPMGGCQSDYITWGLAVRGVTRVWAAQEMGIGTVTVRFMCDDLRFTNDGFPLAADVRLVDDYINVKRPVAVKDYFVLSPIRYPVSVTVSNLSTDTEAVRAAIEQRIADVFRERAEPGGTMYAAWVSEAITATNIRFFDLDFEDAIMPSPGHLAILDTINFED